MQKYSKNRLLNNISYLLLKNNIKISELESRIEVSPGYFSRLRKNENDNVCPNLEVLVSIANTFNCSISMLVYGDFTRLNETEVFLVDAINKLITQTSEDKVVWERIHQTSFMDSGFPLIKETSNNLLRFPEKHYKSLFTGKNETINNVVYYASFMNAFLYLIPIPYKNDERYELYRIKDNAVNKICSSIIDEKCVFNDLLKDLYLEASESSQRIRIDSEVKKDFESFLKNDK